MNESIEAIVRKLEDADFAPSHFERFFGSVVEEISPEGKAEILKWLQEEAAHEANTPQRGSRIHLCLCRTWEVVRDCNRNRRTSDAQLYEAQLPQVGAQTKQLMLH